MPQQRPEFDPGDIVGLWAEARALYLAGVYPKYASPAWLDLDPDDPKRLAGVLWAAEMWRKYGDESALLQWFKDAFASRPPLWQGKTLAELDELAKPRPPHQLQATSGWPPIRVPGAGKWRHHVDGRQVDLPHDRPQAPTPQRRAA